MKPSNSVSGFLGLAVVSLFLTGCRSGEEQANEEALKARNAQFSEMNKQSSGTPDASKK